MKKEEQVQTVRDDQKVELTRALPDGTKTLILDFDNVSGYTLLRCEKAAKKEESINDLILGIEGVEAVNFVSQNNEFNQ